ncbi:MAG TPA: TIGR03118 family protein [Candidatus Eisenbacteria bacterium]|jgi:uncharacterized protein (TIGR03118 family)|nr:TIGR03118 family protein [Candidatus Eisenbacteria bacterium]
MNSKFRPSSLILSLILCGVALLLASAANAQISQEFRRVNLVSDIPGVALRSDPNLVNCWGIAFSPTSPVWIANNGTGTSTLYRGDGTPAPTPAAPLIVKIPSPSAGATAAPTGLVLNTATTGFLVSSGSKSGPSIFIFATEDGTIVGWSPAVDLHNAVIAVNNSGSGAVYKGLATGTSGGKPFIYATNFRDGVVEMYDASFHLTKSFTDPTLPSGYAPFGIENIEGDLYVTFALQDDDKKDDVKGPGHGFIDVFTTDGTWKSRFASNGVLNSPWGLALAPPSFGKFAHRLLVGNFGNGRINAFDFPGGVSEGPIKDTLGQPMAIDGLWGLKFANGGPSGRKNHLLFTAGLADESHGLFGLIRPADAEDQHDDTE